MSGCNCGSGQAMPAEITLSYDGACRLAQQILGAHEPYWLTARCDQIAAHLKTDCTVFVNNPIRLALVGTNECPPPGDPGGSSNGILLGLLALVGIGGVLLVASKRSKKLVIMRR